MTSATFQTGTLIGGRVLQSDPNGTDMIWTDLPLHIQDGYIVDQLDAHQHSYRLDTRGCVVLPGIIDFHGDAFERQIMPRPKVRFPLSLAFLETDRQLASNGITTALHGITYSWEGGLRGGETVTEIMETLALLKPNLQVDQHIHLRFELHNLAGVATVEQWIKQKTIALLAFNDHLPSIHKKVMQPGKLQEYADRAETDHAEFLARLESARECAAAIPQALVNLANLAKAKAIPMASHDDKDTEARQLFRELGCRIGEFPLQRQVAESAIEQNEDVVFGAPNVLRGKSHVGAPNAAELAAEGLCTILASDYYYPAPLYAAFQLAQRGQLPFEKSWALVSANPARALRYADRGRIQAGLRGDVVVVDVAIPNQPKLVATIVAGRIVYLNAPERVYA